jgi:hypothetical protein
MVTLRAVGCGCLTAAALLLTGCTSVVTGSAHLPANAAPEDLPSLKASQLEKLLLSVDDLNKIVNSLTMVVVSDVQELQDSSEKVSDPDCLGSIYSAEKQVYGTGWTAVRDQVIREPGNDNEHWAEQTVVLYPSANEARDIVDQSEAKWSQCGGFSVAVDDSQGSYIWKVDGPKSDGDVITQVVNQEDSDGWNCQHALTSVSNLVVETMACAFGIGDDGATMSGKIVERAVKAAK